MPLFSVLANHHQIPAMARRRAFLVEDNWDDWGKYRTQFHLTIYDDDGNKHEPGLVKIGERGLLPAKRRSPGSRAPTLDREFDAVSDIHFSLGQEETYYETLNNLSSDLRQAVLAGLRDCAVDLDLFALLQDEEVMLESLLRHVSAENVRSRLHRLAMGDATLTRFWFEYSGPSSNSLPEPLRLTFKVEPSSYPPTNVHVFIGRNGVGKTRCMQGMARAILEADAADQSAGVFRLLDDGERDIFGDPPAPWSFAGLIFVSFSAFDHFDFPDAAKTRIRSAAVGLQAKTGTGPNQRWSPKSRHELAADFVESLETCRRGLRGQRWRAAVTTLATDPLFDEADITSLLDAGDNEWKPAASKLFSGLSSGHAVVLLTITRLVEFVDEKSLVLLDEPEGHLHPPLLSAFIRSLADLLVRRNGVAIVSTHSPVVLQEIPRSCVWMMRRSGSVSVAERPSLETFGENVGSLTREVFGLEVTNAGFHKLLRDAVESERLSYETVMQRFGGQLGAEARAIAKALVAERDATKST